MQSKAQSLILHSLYLFDRKLDNMTSKNLTKINWKDGFQQFWIFLRIYRFCLRKKDKFYK